VATASLVHADLDARPDLSPWLASLFVDPPFRGRGHSIRLVRVVEAAARAAGIGTLWLYTAHAEGLYRRLGWLAVGRSVEGKAAVTVMRRDLAL
jgi:N-acetylglutamate synthase-like GNAT family acetyltransferase